MKESFWAMMVVGLGIVSILFIYYFQSVTNTSEHNYELVKESTEAAMFDSLDLAAYRQDRTIRIDREKFVDSFLRRFSENASLSNEYDIKIYDVNQKPPKVSIKVTSRGSDIAFSITGERVNSYITTQIDGILEAKYAN